MIEMNTKITSVLRYPGGKAKALKTVLGHIPKHFSEFREPFVGGGSVFINLKQSIPDSTNFIINDINTDLYYFWLYLKEDGNGFRNAVLSKRNEFSSGKDLFKYYKNTDTKWDTFERAIRFFILNRITFSGLIDSGGYSQQSYEKRFTDSMIDKLIPLSELIQDVTITNNDYSYLLNKKGEDVFIYLDPPYLTSKNSKLYGINGDLHTKFDHKRFAKKVKMCQHKWLITCDDSSEIRELFDFANVTDWSLVYGMTNVNKSNLKKGNELLITNYNISKDLTKNSSLEAFGVK